MIKRIGCIFLFIFSMVAYSQADTSKVTIKKADTSTVAKNKFIPAPYINYSRSIGFAGGIVPMYMLNLNKKDTISPQSLIGGLGIYSTNKTYFAMGFSRLYFKEDTWRVTVAGGIGDINFQVYVSQIINDYVDYGTSMVFFEGRLQRNVFKNLFAGIAIQYLNFDTEFDSATPVKVKNKLFSLGIVADYDQRDNVYYPYNGNLISFEWNSYPSWLGNDETSNSVKTSYNKYIPIRKKKDVLAYRVYGEFGFGDISFNQQTVVGRTDLRGYTQGKYRGNGMMDVQGEYRYNFSKKMGAVGFVGLGTVYGAKDEDINWAVLPSIGVGYRYTIFPANHMNIGLDIAAGKDDWGVYFRIGEAF